MFRQAWAQADPGPRRRLLEEPPHSGCIFFSGRVPKENPEDLGPGYPGPRSTHCLAAPRGAIPFRCFPQGHNPSVTK